MYRSRNARVLELAAHVLPVAPRVSATALPSPPRTAGLNDALNLLGAGKLDETPAILPPLAAGPYGRCGRALQIGLAATGASRKPLVSEGRARRLAGRSHRRLANHADRPPGRSTGTRGVRRDGRGEDAGPPSQGVFTLSRRIDDDAKRLDPR